MSNDQAPLGHVFVCAACGKVSRWRYGFDESERNDATPGWDDSCMLHAELVSEMAIIDPAPWVYPMRVRRVEP